MAEIEISKAVKSVAISGVAALVASGLLVTLYSLLALPGSGMALSFGNRSAQDVPFASPLQTDAGRPSLVMPTSGAPLAREQARKLNAAIPIASEATPAPEPFVLKSSAPDLWRAVDCLAAAALFEAGDTEVGQRAVIQVVINRLKHPAFPNTICAVVFQGSDRSTGCQFTFTCDGALNRTPSKAAIQRARAVAMQALAGAVDPTVGYATHYHTDWVSPYWSASLLKIAAVQTHLFFRWNGTSGQPAAFNRAHAGHEPNQAKLSRLFESHKAMPDDEKQGGGETALTLPGNHGGKSGVVAASASASPLRFEPTARNANVFMVSLPEGLSPDLYPAAASKACGNRQRCIFMAWKGAKHPTQLPASTSDLQTMSFHYLVDPSADKPRARWNCAEAQRPDRDQCLSHQSRG